MSGQSGTDLTLTGLTGNTLTFTTSNWDTAQTVTVKAGQDDDGSDDSVTLTHAAAGGNYAGTKADLTVTVTDNDRGIVFNPTSLTWRRETPTERPTPSSWRPSPRRRSL